MVAKHEVSEYKVINETEDLSIRVEYILLTYNNEETPGCFQLNMNGGKYNVSKQKEPGQVCTKYPIKQPCFILLLRLCNNNNVFHFLK